MTATKNEDDGIKHGPQTAKSWAQFGRPKEELGTRKCADGRSARQLRGRWVARAGPRQAQNRIGFRCSKGAREPGAHREWGWRGSGAGAKQAATQAQVWAAQ